MHASVATWRRASRLSGCPQQKACHLRKAVGVHQKYRGLGWFHVANSRVYWAFPFQRTIEIEEVYKRGLLVMRHMASMRGGLLPSIAV